MGLLQDADKLELRDAKEWRAWLQQNHATSKGAWVLRARAGVERELIGYGDAIRQALCFGWVDGTVKPMGDETVGIWFSPRRPASGWAATNKARVIELEASGEMTDAGRRAVEVAKANGAWTVLDNAEAMIEPDDLTAALDAQPEAREKWDAFPPSARKMGIGAVDAARRPETRAARIAKIVADAAEGRRP